MNQISTNQKLWRYIDLYKLVHLLKERALYFSRADNFSDPLEGAVGLLEHKEIFLKAYHLARISDLRTSGIQTRGTDGKLLPEVVQQVNDDAEQYINEAKNRKLKSFVSCWCNSEHESDAMWRLFCSDVKNGVCLEVDYGKFQEAMKASTRDIEVGKVEYKDYSKDFPKRGLMLFTKQIGFLHENEVRAVTYDPDEPSQGLLVPIDINSVVISIVVSPLADDSFENLVRNLVQRYDCTVPVRSSLMRGEGF